MGRLDSLIHSIIKEKALTPELIKKGVDLRIKITYRFPLSREAPLLSVSRRFLTIAIICSVA